MSALSQALEDRDFLYEQLHRIHDADSLHHIAARLIELDALIASLEAAADACSQVAMLRLMGAL